MDNFNKYKQNNDYSNLKGSFENAKRFMDARDYSDHSYDLQVENTSDLLQNRENIQEFMDVEVNNWKNQS